MGYGKPCDDDTLDAWLEFMLKRVSGNFFEILVVVYGRIYVVWRRFPIGGGGSG